MKKARFTRQPVPRFARFGVVVTPHHGTRSREWPGERRPPVVGV